MADEPHQNQPTPGDEQTPAGDETPADAQEVPAPRPDPTEPSAEEAVEAAGKAVDDVRDAAEQAGPTELTDDTLAAAKAAVTDAASAAAARRPAEPATEPTPDATPEATPEATTEAGPQADPDAQTPTGADRTAEGFASLNLPDLPEGAGAEEARGIDLLSDVNLDVTIELGRTRMLVEDVLKLGEGAVVELDKLAGDPVDVYVNERLVARGEVLVLNDTFCIRVNEIVKGADAVAEAG